MRTPLRSARSGFFAGLVLAALAAGTPAAAQEKSKLDSKLTPTEVAVLAQAVDDCQSEAAAYRRIMERAAAKQQVEPNELRRTLGKARNCLHKAYRFDGKRFRGRRDLLLQQDYNALLERQAGNGSALNELYAAVDGHHRVTLYASRKPGDAFCDEQEWLQLAFDVDKMRERPVTREEFERFIGAAYSASIAQARCLTQRPKTVTYIVTVGETVVAERPFEPSYRLVKYTLVPNTDPAFEFGKAIGAQVLEAAYAALP